MRNLGIGLIVLSALCFLVAVISVLTGTAIVVRPEGLSRACTNLALISIALGLWCNRES